MFRVPSYACMPPSIPRQVRWKLFAHTPPPAAAFPEERAGRLLRYVFRGLLDVYSHCNLHAHRVAKTTLYTEGSSGFVTSAAASVVTGWNEPVPGWGYLPLKSTGFPRRTAPPSLQGLHHYCGQLRPSPWHWYSSSRCLPFVISLAIQNEVLTFHTKACIEFMPPIHRLPSGP